MLMYSTQTAFKYMYQLWSYHNVEKRDRIFRYRYMATLLTRSHCVRGCAWKPNTTTPWRDLAEDIDHMLKKKHLLEKYELDELWVLSKMKDFVYKWVTLIGLVCKMVHTNETSSNQYLQIGRE